MTENPNLLPTIELLKSIRSFLAEKGYINLSCRCNDEINRLTPRAAIEKIKGETL